MVAVVPPWHDPCVFGSVLAEPVVGLSEVVDDLARAGRAVGGQDNAGTWISVAGDPGAVDGEQDKEHWEDDYGDAFDVAVKAFFLFFFLALEDVLDLVGAVVLVFVFAVAQLVLFGFERVVVEVVVKCSVRG